MLYLTGIPTADQVWASEPKPAEESILGGKREGWCQQEMGFLKEGRPEQVFPGKGS